MGLTEEDFKCICGEEFDSMELLQAHWADVTAKPTGKLHYRLISMAGEFEFPPKSEKSKPKE
jgi:hypothetical protein